MNLYYIYKYVRISYTHINRNKTYEWDIYIYVKKMEIEHIKI